MSESNRSTSLKSYTRIGVIGDGAWGTTLAVHLGHKGYPVTLWGAFAENVRHMERNHENTRFLPGIPLGSHVTPTDDLKCAIEGRDLIIWAVPSEFTRDVLRRAKHFFYQKATFLSITKGIDPESLSRMSEVIREELGEMPLAVLTGPTIAVEVARQLPASAVIGCPDARLARRIQAVINTDTFRIYTNTDVVGLEVAGSLKNVIALACGVCDGMGYGSNTKAALLTRGLVEIARLGRAMGGRQKTFSGLAGMGDLVTTCFSPKSRNRTVGEQLGKGKDLQTILSAMNSVAEGVITAQAAYRLGTKHHVSMPISTEVYNILYHHKPPQRAVQDLMTRRTKAE